MHFVRILAPGLKPALAGGALLAAAAGGWLVIDRLHGDALTPFAAIQDDGQLLLLAEFGDTADAIVAIEPGDASDRKEIAHIRHAAGYGVFAALSPDGTAIAYTALPEDELEPSGATPALAGIVDATGGVEILANDVDLLIPPVWAPDGGSIVVRRNTPVVDSAGVFELLMLGRDGSRVALASRDGAALFPIAFSPNGALLYFATLDATGSDLWSVGADGSGELSIAHLSDEIARDWTLSPDGGTIAYTVAESGARPRIATMTVDLASAVVADAVEGPVAQLEFSPAWTPAGGLTVAAVDGGTGSGATLSVELAGGATTLTETAAGVDLPLAWSPDGRTLAVRAVDGAAGAGGRGGFDLISASGIRESVSADADVLIVGWLR